MTVPSQTKWTTEMRGKLAKLHGDGFSGTLIASELNKEFGTTFSRNAIMGALHRSGMTKRQSTKFAWPHSVERRKDNGGGSVYSIARRQITGFKLLEKQKISEAPFLGIALLDLKDGQCRFPRGEKPTLFCGQPQKEDSSYCPHCHSIATRPFDVH